ncbi:MULTISPECIES: TIGR02452 family protein [unclassified Fibrobacter]|uniref:TIGR02452 family protein n=1 Tax=unclassified Fibrobacter TaxID=2634177 RepID=UPI000D6D82C0|nr:MULTISPECIES: TIGR02452 family protein [unclassified Fibrobacter]PWJ68950.1 uncharacterized protein (TIGR02452 family) [Fibrobacter sp. UWR4]PZW63553.1 uncharacterized protein (TIGR02452 family) [Fibrobacter sp. UWR1]
MRDNLVEIFEDTLSMIVENTTLKKVVEVSSKGAKLYPEGEDVPGFNEACNKVPDLIQEGAVPEVTVTSHRTFEAARKLHGKYPGKRIGVQNFASATNPGGGVTDGAAAQEECLCRCSTLYPVLKRDDFFQNYYRFHRRRHDHIYTDACIYVPHVAVVKSDEQEPKRVPSRDWFAVDVITCAAPNLWFDADALNAEELLKVHLKRGEKILQVAIANHVDVLVLGAFGCGAFRNDPKIVAEAYRQLMQKYGKYFTAIEFAVYCSPYHGTDNYDAFKDAMT